MQIRPDSPTDPAIAELLAFHVREARAATPAENAHALPAEGLAAPDIAFFAAWDGPDLLGIGALKTLDDRHGEIKSMRTAPTHLRKGVARAMVAHLIAAARARGFTRVSLETGTALTYAAANALYEAMGFVDGPVFGGYPTSPHNRFMTLTL